MPDTLLRLGHEAWVRHVLSKTLRSPSERPRRRYLENTHSRLFSFRRMYGFVVRATKQAIVAELTIRGNVFDGLWLASMQPTDYVFPTPVNISTDILREGI